MNVYVQNPDHAGSTSCDTTVIFSYQDSNNKSFSLTKSAKDIDVLHDSLPSTIAKKQHFQAFSGKTVICHTRKQSLSVHTIIVVGLGKKDKITARNLIESVGAGIKLAKSMKSTSIALCAGGIVCNGLSDVEIVTRIVDACHLATYEYHGEKIPEDANTIEHIDIYVEGYNRDEMKSACDTAQLVSRAVLTARDLVNTPSSVATPRFLSQLARSYAQDNHHISCRVFGEKEMKKKSMNALLSIAKGSDEEPQFIELRYTPARTAKKTLCFVGKGVTFDSGGLSLKPGQGMETMKRDMAGAATVLALFSILEYLKPDVSVVGLICAVENMPSGKAVKPGDIVKASNGKSIEIINTDAEGRVILSDALSYAGMYVKPDVIIDIATLTGACMVALGEDVAGLFSNADSLSSQLLAAAQVTGELLWRMPLVESYKELIESPVADVRNLGKTRYAGAITAALFLETFVPENTDWAHVDIAGPAWAEKDSSTTPVGGTGYGIRTLIEYLRSYNRTAS